MSDLKVRMLLGWQYLETVNVVRILDWPASVLECAARSKQTLWRKGELVRKGQMFVYVFELCYQLCMSVNDVVSESPGCEVPWFMFIC